MTPTPSPGGARALGDGPHAWPWAPPGAGAGDKRQRVSEGGLELLSQLCGMDTMDTPQRVELADVDAKGKFLSREGIRKPLCLGCVYARPDRFPDSVLSAIAKRSR